MDYEQANQMIKELSRIADALEEVSKNPKQIEISLSKADKDILSDIERVMRLLLPI